MTTPGTSARIAGDPPAPGPDGPARYALGALSVATWVLAALALTARAARPR